MWSSYEQRFIKVSKIFVWIIFVCWITIWLATKQKYAFLKSRIWCSAYLHFDWGVKYELNCGISKAISCAGHKLFCMQNVLQRFTSLEMLLRRISESSNRGWRILQTWRAFVKTEDAVESIRALYSRHPRLRLLVAFFTLSRQMQV
jgi:hypothetical protein